MKQFIFMGLTLLICAVALAGGNEAANGTHVLLRNNETVLADPFVPRVDLNQEIPGTPVELSRELSTYLLHVRELLSRYGIYSEGFWFNRVFGNRVQYRYLEDLPCKDEIKLKPGVEGESVLAACTQGAVTWIKPSIFKTLNVKKQTVVLFHERLHDFTNAQHELISEMSATLLMMLTLQNEQFNGQYRELTSEEMEALLRLPKVAELLGFAVYSLYDPFTTPYFYGIHSKGGGIVINNYKDGTIVDTMFGKDDQFSIDPTAFIGIGSIVKDSQVSADAVIVHSQVECSKIGTHSILKNVKEFRVSTTGQHVVIENGSEIFRTLIGDETYISDSWISGDSSEAHTFIGSSCFIKGSSIGKGYIGYNNTILDSTMRLATAINIGNYNQLQNIKSNITASYYIGNATSLNNIVLWGGGLIIVIGDNALISNLSHFTLYPSSKSGDFFGMPEAAQLTFEENCNIDLEGKDPSGREIKGHVSIKGNADLENLPIRE